MQLKPTEKIKAPTKGSKQYLREGRESLLNDPPPQKTKQNSRDVKAPSITTNT